jgi:predicted P-loop ATPase
MFAEWLQRHGIDVSSEIAGKAVEAVARERTIHPVRDYLNCLKWDGVPRLDGCLERYFGVQATTPEQAAYRSAVGRRWMISAVARIMKPGCKVDHCLVLEGRQGLLKSTSLEALAGGPAWFTDELGDLGTKDASLQLSGKWIIELAEVTALVRSDSSAAKAFLSRPNDHFRPPYGKRTGDFPRQCVFAGTTNDTVYLKDETGNRRFWPVTCTVIDLDGLRRDRDQLWAEAVVRYERGERWWLDTPELNDQAAEEQADRYETDPWQELVEEYCSPKDSVSIAEVLTSIKPKDRWDRRDQMRVARCLKALGWDRHRARGVGVGPREWRYFPKTACESQP